MQVIMGRKADGTYQEIAVDNDGNLAKPSNMLYTSGIRGTAIGDGEPVIAAVAGKAVEYHIIKIQRIPDAGVQKVGWKSGATVIDPDLLHTDINQASLSINYAGNVVSGINEAQYLTATSEIQFSYWISYRLI